MAPKMALLRAHRTACRNCLPALALFFLLGMNICFRDREGSPSEMELHLCFPRSQELLS